MIGLFTRPARRTRPTRTGFGSRLRLEHLETRDCPAAPVLTSTTVTALAGGQVEVHGVVQGVINQVFVLRLLGRLEEQRRVRRRVLRLVLGDGLEVARVGHNRRVTFQRFEQVHAVTS